MSVKSELLFMLGVRNNIAIYIVGLICFISCCKLKANTENIILFKAVGDIMPGTNFPVNRLPANRGRPLFEAIKTHLAGADVLLGNFESTLTNYPHTGKNVKRRLVFAFRTPPIFARTMAEAGFHVLSTANNHSFDFLQKGFQDTMKNIRRAGILAVGQKHQIGYLTVKKLRIAFIGFSYLRWHNSIKNYKATKIIIKKADEQADIVVITVHAGAEGTRALHVRNKTELFYRENRGNIVRFAHLAIDSGADLILGHGPHVPRAFELYKKRLIAYSLGNFIGYRAFRISGPLGLSLILEAHLKRNGEFFSGRIIPVRLKKRGIPFFDSSGKSIRLIKRLTRSDFPNTPLRIYNNGRISIKRYR